ncbi:MAG: transketolase [Deltaproteobacteria bacterium]|nr:transketolase [Deltaproteobacteria bacterium]
MLLAAEELQLLSERARLLRVGILQMLHASKSGHTGGSLSAIDIICALYFAVMRHNPQEPRWQFRDRFVLSKGHAAPALYATLAECGYFSRSSLATLRQLGSSLQGHPNSRLTPGVDATSGSLGQGLSVANGIALGLRLDENPAHTFVLLGDGELQEGQVWEAAMSAAHFQIGKVTAIVDNNGLQIDGFTKDIMNVEPLVDKWSAFGWDVEVIDGHNLTEVVAALSAKKSAAQFWGKPTAIIAKTIKGKGVSLFENKAKYHGVVPNDEELKIALKELGAE